MPDNVAFLYGLQAKGLCNDWLPFKQSTYIREVLHGNETSKSPYAEGVCAALCEVVLDDWIQNGVRSDKIGQLDRTSTAENVEGLAHEMETSPLGTTKVFVAHMKSRGYNESGYSLLAEPKKVIQYVTNNGLPCLTGWYAAGEKSGHAIICDGPRNAIFDPNVGYMRATSSNNFQWVYSSLLSSFYPEYAGNNSACEVAGFKR